MHLHLESPRQADVLALIAELDAYQQSLYPAGRVYSLGLAKRRLALLEAQALERGCRLPTLETGIHQPEAIALYARHGYQRRGPYGHYPHDPLSVFMEKPLALAA